MTRRPDLDTGPWWLFPFPTFGESSKGPFIVWLGFVWGPKRADGDKAP